MEVIYYMRNYYPLTAAQKMHHNWIMDYGTQQVSGVSVVASVQAELDFGLLKKCIQMETERSGCTRVRFTKPDKDGNVKQYIEKQDSRDIELKDLSGMESLAKADELMQQWAYETFDGDNIPMCEFIMLKLPEGYNGFFLHMDHRLIDSCGLVVMIEDLFQLYTHYRYGTACPQELVDFEKVLKKEPMVLGPGVKTGLNILMDNPGQLGADLVANAVAGIHEYSLPLAIIDMGTASTVSVVDEKKHYVGGMIFPGMGVSLDALTARASQLSGISIEAPKRIIGKNTIECMKSGVIYSNAAALDGIVDRIEEELGQKITVVATGGLARKIIPHCKREILLDEDLLLKGLLIIYEKNRKEL